MIGQANTFYMFAKVTNNAVQIDAQQDGDNLIAKFTSTENGNILLMSLDNDSGFWSMAYHVIYEDQDQTSQDKSNYFPGSALQDFCALVINDVF